MKTEEEMEKRIFFIERLLEILEVFRISSHKPSGTFQYIIRFTNLNFYIEALKLKIQRLKVLEPNSKLKKIVKIAGTKFLCLKKIIFAKFI